jgi:nucleotide-binding universal stress UspA family protein
MKTKILLPTDFSKNALYAIQYALMLFENRGCDFYILNGSSKKYYGLDSLNLLDPDESFRNMSDRRSKERLGDLMLRLMFENTNSQHKFYVLSRSEPFLDAIKNVTEELNIDMIVMGARGITDGRKSNYGKNALNVIENNRKCPVLVIPENVTLGSLQEIVLATNFKTDFEVSEIKHLVKIAKISRASIEVLSLANNHKLNPQQKKNKMLIKTYLKDVTHSFNVLHNVKMATALSCFVELRKSDMISFIDKKPSVWERLGFGKTTLGKLGYYEHIPVLALHS